MLGNVKEKENMGKKQKNTYILLFFPFLYGIWRTLHDVLFVLMV